MEILLHFSLGCPHQDPGAILPPFLIREGPSGYVVGVLTMESFLHWGILLPSQRCTDTCTHTT